MLLSALVLGGCAAYTHRQDGLKAIGRGDWAEGVLELQKASELSPGDVEYRQAWLSQRELAIQHLLAGAESAFQQSQPGIAERNYRDVLRIDRGNSRALAGLEDLATSEKVAAELVQAKEAMARQDVAKAETLVARVLDRQPRSQQARALQREIASQRSSEVPVAPNLSTAYRKPVNLEFRDASLKVIFDALSRTTGINFIFDRDIKPDQRATVVVRQTSLEDAIDVLLSTSQLEKKVLNATSVLIYPATTAKLKEYQDLVVRAFYLSNTEAKTAARLLTTVLKLKDVYVDDKLHLIVLRESPETIALAEKLISLQDLEEPEVMLEVEVLEINRTRLLNLGVQLPDQFTLTPLPSSVISGPNSGTTGPQSMRLSELRGLASDRIGITVPSVTVNVQKTDGDANLLANPRLRVRDREKARILIGGKVPVVTTTTTPNGFLSESIQYLDVGLKLEVEPEIHLHDEVALKLSLEVSSVVGAIKTASGSQAYQLGTRNITSSLRLKDGETQVLAGLINDADRSDASRVPFLGDVPLLGRLFSSQKDDRQKTEIVMSITPHLIRNIQRKGPGAEAFWSGTEATLRTRPIQLRAVGPDHQSKGEAPAPKPTSSNGPSSQASTQHSSGQAGGGASALGLAEGAVQLTWHGPSTGKAREIVRLELKLVSEQHLRAAPVHIAYRSDQLEVVSVQDGGYFGAREASNFSHVVDPASGRIVVGAGTSSPVGVKGEGRVLWLEVRPFNGVSETELSVVGVTPVGMQSSPGRPELPIAHKITVIP